MSQVSSSMLPLGTRAPDFLLPDTVSGAMLSLHAVAGRAGTLVMFICNHCPYVRHVDAEIAAVAREAQARGVGCVAISSNDVALYPADAPDKMTAYARSAGFPFPYLYDESQSAARAYQAACTPDFYLVDAGQALVYRGRLDGATPGNGRAVDGRDLRAAIDSLLSGNPPLTEQKPSVGCSIKWKK